MKRYGLSRRSAQEAVLNGRVDLDGVVCDEPGRMVAVSRSILFDPNRPKRRRVRTDLKIHVEDARLLVVEKPAGTLTHPASNETNTLVDQVRRYLEIRRGGNPNVWVVHRLDRETTGAIVFACDLKTAQAIQDQFRDHRVIREYLAIVEGAPERDEGVLDRGIVEEPGRLRRRVARPGEAEKVEPAVTHYRVLERFKNRAALVACRLETGRTHQIRIHMSGIGHPLAGDLVYRPKRPRYTAITFSRVALHARTLEFQHPWTKAAIAVESPIPGDMRRLLDKLREDVLDQELRAAAAMERGESDTQSNGHPE